MASTKVTHNDVVLYPFLSACFKSPVVVKTEVFLDQIHIEMG